VDPIEADAQRGSLVTVTSLITSGRPELLLDHLVRKQFGATPNRSSPPGCQHPDAIHDCVVRDDGSHTDRTATLAIGRFEHAPEHHVEPLGIAASMTSLDRPATGEVRGRGRT
jgi:hypothetical protein